MSLEDNKALMRRLVEEFWNNKRLEVADALFAPSVTSPTAPWAPPGPTGVKLAATMIFTAFPDFHMSIDQMVATGDRVAARYVETGTHQGAFMGVAPTGRKVCWTEIGILRIQDGKVVENWFEPDMLTLLQQLGAVPAPGQATSSAVDTGSAGTLAGPS